MRILSFIGVMCTLFIALGCTSKGVTQLGGSFSSYQSPSDVRNRLQREGLSGRWREEHKGLAPRDPRPAYDFVTMSGPYIISGVEDRFELTFYNGRLMSTEFSTARGAEVIAAMRVQGIKVPQQPRSEITLDRRTRFRYDVDPDGTFRFNWTDTKLEEESSEWVGKYA